MKAREILKIGRLICSIGCILTALGLGIAGGVGYLIALFVFMILLLVIRAIEVALERKTEENQKE